MQSVKVLLLIFFALYLFVEKAYGNYGVAVFNIRGIKGSIKFIPATNNNNVTIMVDIGGTNQDHSWHVHNLPVNPTLPPTLRCANDYIGGHYDPLGAIASFGDNYDTYCSTTNQTACEVGDLSGKLGKLTAGTATYVDTTGQLSLYGRYGIIGRSIKIHGSEDVCATIVSAREMAMTKPKVTMLQASFTYPVGGTIYMRQVEGEDTVIFGKMYWVNGLMATENHNWHVHRDQPGVFYREGKCGNIGGHYNPFDVDVSSTEYMNYCGPDNLTICEVGDLSGKHGRLTVSDNPFAYERHAFFYHDNFINLTGINAVANRSIAIHAYNRGVPVIACAPLVEVETLVVGVYAGMFSASQSSKFAPTDVTTNYGASDLRVFSSAIAPNGLCQAEFGRERSAIFNPHNQPNLDGSDKTPDRYPVGDIARKYNFTNRRRVFELPIHGTETIAGHSLGFRRRLVSSTEYICSSLWPNYPIGSNVKMAKATFNNTVSGGIYFVQRSFGNGVYGNTYIFVDIWYTNSSRSLTTGHNFHIHEGPPQINSCDSIGGHFNPFNVTLQDNYGNECSRYAPLRCESGDLSKKHPQLNISSRAVDRTTYTYVDSNLHLWGPSNYSIIGRSVGLHLPASAGGSIFDCGAIREVVAASRFANFTFLYDSNFDRTTFATELTNNVNDASPSDLLMVRQAMTATSTMSRCVNMTARVLGNSVDEANTKLNDIMSQFNSLYKDECSGAMMIYVPSLLLIVLIFISIVQI